MLSIFVFVVWDGMVTNEIQLFEFINYEWNGMEHDKTHFIQFHSNLYFLFHPIWDICDEMRHF